MRICFYCPLDGVHGGIRILIEMANRLKKLGHEVYIAPMEPPKSTIIPVEVPLIDYNNQENWDLAISTWHPTAFHVFMNVKAKRRAYLVMHDEGWIYNSPQAYDTYELPWDLCIGIAPWLIRMLQGYHQPTYLFVPAFDPTYFHPYDNKDSNRISYFYRPIDRKFYREGLAAMEIIKRKRPQTEIITFDTEARELPAMVTKHIIGPQNEELGKLYSSSAVYFQSTLKEGFGILSLEAMACGTCVVTPDRGGTEGFGEGIIDYPTTDPGDIAEKVIYLLDHPEVRAEKEKKGLEVVKSITWQDQVEKLDKFLCELQ